MNPNNRHNIKSLLFDIIFDDERRATELYDDIRRIHYQELEDVICRCLDQFVGVEVFASLDEIELDLGPIHYRDLNAQFAQKVHDSLTEKIKDLLRKSKSTKGIQISNSYTNIDLIKHYLEEGYLPWNTNENVNDLFAKCLKKERSGIIELLKSIGKSKQVRERIISRFDISIIIEIIQILRPSNSELIRQFHRQVCQGVLADKSLNFKERKLGKELYLLILNYLLINPLRGGRDTGLVKDVLIQFSEKFHFPFFKLVTLLANEIRYSNDAESLGLENILADISKGLKLKLQVKENRENKFFDLEFNEKTEFLIHFLSNKNSISNIESVRLRYMQQHLMELLYTSPTSMITALKENKKTSILIKQIVNYFGLKPIYALVRRMEPGSFKTIINYHQDLVEIHQKEPLTAITNKAFSYGLWEIILQLLVNRSGTYFNQIVFLKSVITQLSNHYNIDYHDLIERLQQTALKIVSKHSRIPVFIKLLSEIYNENNLDKSKFSLIKQKVINLSVDFKIKKNTKLLNDQKQDESYYNSQQTKKIIQDYFYKKESLISLSLIRRILVDTLAEEPKFILNTIKEHPNYFLIVEKLVFDFDEELIQKIVKVIEPINYKSVINYQKNTIRLQKKKQIIRTSSVELSDALWSIILKILLSRSSSRFNKRSFLIKLLGQTAAHYNIDYTALIDQLWSAINTNKIIGSEESNYSAFIQLIREIKLEENTKRTKGLKTINSKIKSIQNNSDKKEKVIAETTKSISRISESLIQLILESPNESSELFAERGFENIEEAVQYLILYQKESLINVLKKTSSIVLRKFIIRLPDEAVEILIHSFHNHTALSIQDFLIRFNSRLYHFGIQQREKIMQKIKVSSLTFLLQSSTSSSQLLLSDLEILIDQYKLPERFFEEKESWKIPVKGNLDDNLRGLEEKLSREIENQFLAKSKTAVLLEEMFASSKQKYSKVSYEKKKEIKVEQEIFINNAGLVILNGYLHFFFDQCGYLDESGSMKPALAKRAALLLQYVFDPETNYPEEQLMLNKILCGLAVNEVLPTEFEANEVEKDITSKMLDAIIAHWKMVSNSTHEGFRESWLQRKGKLTKKEKHWELQVEKSSFDILLDYKPFTLSPVNFDWMKKSIKVNWR